MKSVKIREQYILIVTLYYVLHGSMTLTASYPMGTGGSFPRGKAAGA